jgi:hypothetical protein
MSSEYNKGKTIDTGDLLTQRKRNTLNQVIASKKGLGIYKPSSYDRGFELINLQRQNGIDSDLRPKTTFKLFPLKNFRRG